MIEDQLVLTGLHKYVCALNRSIFVDADNRCADYQ